MKKSRQGHHDMVANLWLNNVLIPDYYNAKNSVNYVMHGDIVNSVGPKNIDPVFPFEEIDKSSILTDFKVFSNTLPAYLKKIMRRSGNYGLFDEIGEFGKLFAENIIQISYSFPGILNVMRLVCLSDALCVNVYVKEDYRREGEIYGLILACILAKAISEKKGIPFNLIFADINAPKILNLGFNEFIAGKMEELSRRCFSFLKPMQSDVFIFCRDMIGYPDAWVNFINENVHDSPLMISNRPISHEKGHWTSEASPKIRLNKKFIQKIGQYGEKGIRCFSSLSSNYVELFKQIAAKMILIETVFLKNQIQMIDKAFEAFRVKKIYMVDHLFIGNLGISYYAIREKIDVILLPHADISLAKSHFSGKWYKMAYSFCQKTSAFLPGYGVKYIEKTNFIDLFGKSNQKGRDWFNWGRIRKKGFFYITKKVYLFIKSFLRRRYLTLENYLFFFKTREKRKIGFLLNGELCDLFCYMDINKLACFIGRLGSVFDTASGFCVVVKTKPRYTDKSWMDLVLHKFGIHSVYVVPNNFTIQDYARKIDLLVVSEFHTGVLKTMSNGIPCVAVSNIEFPVCIDQPYAFIPASILPTLSPAVILDLLKNKEALTSLASRQKDWSACQVGL